MKSRYSEQTKCDNLKLHAKEFQVVTRKAEQELG